MSALVFVADDDDRCRRLVREVVEYGGHRAELFADGLQLLQRMDQLAPDLLIVDIHMPAMSGIEVLKAVRQRSPAHLPVIAMTASVMPSERRQLAEAGFTVCLAKPLSLKHLADVIRAELTAVGGRQ